MHIPHNVFVGKYSSVFSESFVWFFFHLLKLIVPHPLKETAHVLFTSFQLHPLGVKESACVQQKGAGETFFTLYMIYVVSMCTTQANSYFTFSLTPLSLSPTPHLLRPHSLFSPLPPLFFTLFLSSFLHSSLPFHPTGKSSTGRAHPALVPRTLFDSWRCMAPQKSGSS